MSTPMEIKPRPSTWALGKVQELACSYRVEDGDLLTTFSAEDVAIAIDEAIAHERNRCLSIIEHGVIVVFAPGDGQEASMSAFLELRLSFANAIRRTA